MGGVRRWVRTPVGYWAMFAMGEGSCLKPGGIWKAEVGTEACEKLDFWVVVDMRTTVCMAGAPEALVGAGAGSVAGAGAGAAFLWWKPPRTELARALVKMPVLPLTWLASPEAVCVAVLVATSPATDWPLGGGVESEAVTVPAGTRPPMLVVSRTRVPLSLAISLAIWAMASEAPGWPPRS